MKTPVLVAAVLLGAAAAFAQTGPSAQQLFEAGQYEPALRALNERREGGASDSADRYLAAQIHVRLNRPAEAKQELEFLTEDPNTVWRPIGESAQALIDKDMARALERGAEGAAKSPDHFFAQYQLGLVKAERGDWMGAAEAFDRATKLNPSFAYAYYHAGFAYSKVRRTDRMAEHFERFLKLAPKAPERLAVESIMRTVRG